jgi:hypothetical protein
MEFQMHTNSLLPTDVYVTDYIEQPPLTFEVATEIVVGSIVTGWWGIGQVYKVQPNGYGIVTLYRLNSGNLICGSGSLLRFVHEEDITDVIAGVVLR